MPRSNRNKWSLPLNLDSNSSGGTQQVGHDEIFKAVQEMFDGQVEPEVIHLILEEYSWEVEKVLECLFDLCGNGSSEKIKKSKLRQIAEDILIGSSFQDVETNHQRQSNPSADNTVHGMAQNETSVSSSHDYSLSVENESRKSLSIFRQSSELSTLQGNKESYSPHVSQEESMALAMQDRHEVCNLQQPPKNIGTIGDRDISKWQHVKPFELEKQVKLTANTVDDYLSVDETTFTGFSNNSDSKFFPSSRLHGDLSGHLQAPAGLCTMYLPSENVNRCSSTRLGAIGDHFGKPTSGSAVRNAQKSYKDGDDDSNGDMSLLDKLWAKKENNFSGDLPDPLSRLKDFDVIIGSHSRELHGDSIDDEIFVSPEKSFNFDDKNDSDVFKLKKLQMEKNEDSEICAVQKSCSEEGTSSQDGLKGRHLQSHFTRSSNYMQKQSTDVESPSTHMDSVLSSNVLSLQIPVEKYKNYDIDRLNSNELDSSFTCGLSAAGFSSPLQLPINSRSDTTTKDSFYFPSAYDTDGAFKTVGSQRKEQKSSKSFFDNFGRTSLSPNVLDSLQTVETDNSKEKDLHEIDTRRKPQINSDHVLPYESCLDFINSDDESDEIMANTLTRALKKSLNMTEALPSVQTKKENQSDSESSFSSPEKLADVMTAALKKSLGITGISPDAMEKEQRHSDWNVLGLVPDSTWTSGQSDVYYSDDDTYFKENSAALKPTVSDNKSNEHEQSTVTDSKSVLSVDAPEFVPAFIPPMTKQEQNEPTFLTPKYSTPTAGSPSIAPVYAVVSSKNDVPKLPFPVPVQTRVPAPVPAPAPWGHPLPTVPLIPVMPISQIASPPIIAPPINYSAVVTRAVPPGPPPHVPMVEIRGPPPESEDIRRVRKIIVGQLCMIVLRGLPGSGKSTLARSLKGRGVIFSTDDYFIHNGVYTFDPQQLPKAHDWNRLRTIDELKKKTNPIIIDNTNTQAWEMKPYLKLASKFGYEAILLEPDTPWKFKPKELARKNMHGVPIESIQNMLERYQKNLTVQIIMGKSWLNNAQGRQTKQLQVTQRGQLEQSDKINNADEEHVTKDTDDAHLTDWGMDIDLTYPDTVIDSKVSGQRNTTMSTPAAGNGGEDFGPDTDMAKLVENYDSDSDTDMTKMAGIHDDWGVGTEMTKVSRGKNDWQSETDLAKEFEGEGQSWDIEPSAHWKHRRFLSHSSQSPSLSETGSSVSGATGGTESDRIDEAFSVVKVKSEVNNVNLSQCSNMENTNIMASLYSNENKPPTGSFEEVKVVVEAHSKEHDKFGSSGSIPSLSDTESHSISKKQSNSLQSTSLLSNVNSSRLSVSPVKGGTLLVSIESSPSSASTEYQTCSDVHTDQEDLLISQNVIVHDDDIADDSLSDKETEVPEICGLDIDGVQAFSGAELITVDSNAYNIDTEKSDIHKNIFSQLETEIREQVEELILENVGQNIDPDKDYTKTAEELKAILMFMSLENDQKLLAEKLIDQRLIHKIPMQDDGPVSLVAGSTQKQKMAAAEIYRSSSEEGSSHDNSEVLEIQESSLSLQWERPKPPGTEHPERQKHSKNKDRSKFQNKGSEQSLVSFAVQSDVIGAFNGECSEKNTQLSNLCLQKDKTSWEEPQPQREKYSGGHDRNRDRVLESSLMKEEGELQKRCDLVFDVYNATDNTFISPNLSEPLSAPEMLSSESSPKHEVLVKPKKKKKSSRKKPSSFYNKPFFDNEVKEQFLSSNWELPDVSSSSSEPVSPQKQMKSHIAYFHKLTEITPSDLKILDNVNRGNDSSMSPYRILVSSCKEINDDDSVDAEGSSDNYSLKDDAILCVIKSKSFRDRSTMTEEIFDAGLDFLINSFPSVPKNELSDTLQQCSNDVEWAASLLLDWKYHLTLSPKDKQKFVSNMYRIQHYPKSATIPKSSPATAEHRTMSPESLLDLCVTYVEQQKIAERREIEQQMIMSSQQRLNSIEENIRVHRLGSFINESEHIIEDDGDFDREQILRELTLKSAEDDVSDGSSQVYEERDGLGVTTSVDGSVTPVSDVSRGQSVESMGRSEASSMSAVEEEDQSVGRFPSEAVLSITIPPDVIHTLIDLFGSVTGKGSGRDNVVIPLDLDAAAALHRCWKEASNLQLVDRNRQLKEDEEFARKLQEEEDASIAARHRHLSNVGHRQVRSDVTPLKDIIKEEIEKEQKREQQQQILQASGNHDAIATKLKRKKLYEEFPGIDETLLDDLFADNCYNLDNTIRAIQGFLSHDPTPPRHVMTSEAADAYENKLIEAAKQQSLQEMLDSCLHVPMVSKDYQTTDSPEYEDYRGEANVHYRLRHECFQKAQEAFRRGLKEVASFYSQQGHQHTQKIKEANMRASEIILGERNHFLEENSTLDLHGLHVDEAVAALERILPKREKEYQTNPDKRKQHLIVITGRGSHSKGGVAKLRPAVLAYLQKKEYRFTVHTGYLKVLLKYRAI